LIRFVLLIHLLDLSNIKISLNKYSLKKTWKVIVDNPILFCTILLFVGGLVEFFVYLIVGTLMIRFSAFFILLLIAYLIPEKYNNEVHNSFLKKLLIMPKMKKTTFKLKFWKNIGYLTILLSLITITTFSKTYMYAITTGENSYSYTEVENIFANNEYPEFFDNSVFISSIRFASLGLFYVYNDNLNMEFNYAFYSVSPYYDKLIIENDVMKLLISFQRNLTFSIKHIIFIFSHSECENGFIGWNWVKYYNYDLILNNISMTTNSKLIDDTFFRFTIIDTSNYLI
ncbi:MAG: hypothetical protein ACTSSP_07900, partial [Candidatus Asgardarchaeia archaeon]